MEGGPKALQSTRAARARTMMDRVVVQPQVNPSLQKRHIHPQSADECSCLPPVRLLFRDLTSIVCAAL